MTKMDNIYAIRSVLSLYVNTLQNQLWQAQASIDRRQNPDQYKPLRNRMTLLRARMKAVESTIRKIKTCPMFLTQSQKRHILNAIRYQMHWLDHEMSCLQSDQNVSSFAYFMEWFIPGTIELNTDVKKRKQKIRRKQNKLAKLSRFVKEWEHY